MQPPEKQASENHDSRPKLALLGASVRAAAQSARRGGYYVIGIDLFGDTDTRASCDEFYLLQPDHPATLAPIAAAVRGVSVRRVGGIRRPLDDRLPSDGNQPSSATWRNFDDLEEFADDSVVRFPEVIAATKPPPAGRWLRKQLDSCGGLGVGWATAQWAADSERTSEAAASDAGLRDVVFQRWIRGRPFGATLMHDGTRTELIGVCRSTVIRLGDLPFVYSGSIGPVHCRGWLHDALVRFGASAAKSRNLCGLFNIDFILDSQRRIWVLEINPRWSASMELIELRLRESDPKQSLIAAGLQAEARPLSSEAWSRLVCQPGTTYVKRIHFASRSMAFDRREWERNRRPAETLHDLPVDGQRILAGEPICTTIEAIQPVTASSGRSASSGSGPMKE